VAYRSRTKKPLVRRFRKRFAQEVVANGFRPQQAYKTLRPHVKDTTAHTNSLKLLKTSDVQEELDSVLRRITPQYVLDGIERIAKDAKKDDTKLNAWVALGRYLSLFKDSPTTQTAVINAIDLDSIKRELAKESKKELTNSNTQLQDESKDSIVDPLVSHNQDYKTLPGEKEGGDTVPSQPPATP